MILLVHSKLHTVHTFLELSMTKQNWILTLYSSFEIRTWPGNSERWGISGSPILNVILKRNNAKNMRQSEVHPGSSWDERDYCMLQTHMHRQGANTDNTSRQTGKEIGICGTRSIFLKAEIQQFLPLLKTSCWKHSMTSPGQQSLSVLGLAPGLLSGASLPIMIPRFSL